MEKVRKSIWYYILVQLEDYLIFPRHTVVPIYWSLGDFIHFVVYINTVGIHGINR